MRLEDVGVLVVEELETHVERVASLDGAVGRELLASRPESVDVLHHREPWTVLHSRALLRLAAFTYLRTSAVEM